MSHDDDAGHRRPRWVTVAAVVALVLAVLVLALALAGGSHGPGRHMSSAELQRPLPASTLLGG